jgi:hypothetical protein
MPRVRGQCLWDDKECIREGCDTPLGFTLYSLPESFTREMSSAGHLERAASWYYALVYNHVVDTPQPVSYGILDL